jgi:hypothetical protein
LVRQAAGGRWPFPFWLQDTPVVHESWIMTTFLAINIVVCEIVSELQNRCVYCNQRLFIIDARILFPKSDFSECEYQQ